MSSTTITVDSPAGTGTVNVTVTTTSGTSATSSADDFTYVPPPTVTSISVSTGPTTGGILVMISGTGFSLATTVTFGSAPALFTIDSDTEITAITPVSVDGTVGVSVESSGGTGSDPDSFLYVPTTTTTLTSSLATASYGQTFTLTASVRDATGNPQPTGGTVSFWAGTTELASGVPLASGTATSAPLTLPIGSFSLHAVYSGVPSQFLSSTSAVSPLSTISTAAGTGLSGGYSSTAGPATAISMEEPVGVAFDSAGDLFIVDYVNSVVYEVSAATHVMSVVAGDGVAGHSGTGGPATAASLNYPMGVAVDAAGNLFIADTGNDEIREVLHSNGDIETIAGNGTAGSSGDGGPATSAELDAPQGVAVDAMATSTSPIPATTSSAW